MPNYKYCLVVVLTIACNFSLHAQQKQVPFKLFFEKAYLHTDKDLYIKSDTIWYKAYLVNAQNNQTIGTSGNLYVDLISRDSSKIVASQIIHLDYGVGNGDFNVPDSIPIVSGKYTLRAYTNWMRNFGDNFIFEKEIAILNIPEVKAPITAIGNAVGGKGQKNTSTSVMPVANRSVVGFYPESGSLVEDVSSLVAVKAEDKFGKGVSLSGIVLTAKGDTAAHFNCDTLGMGMFVLLTLKGQKYHAEIIANGKPNIVVEMATPLQKGFALRVSHADSLLNVIVSCNDAQLAEAAGKVFTLTGRHGGKAYFSEPIEISDKQLLIHIAKNLLPEGVAAITLSDEQNKPYCERLVYIHHSNTQQTISVNADKAEYKSKEKVTINIKTIPKTNLSIAVVDAGVVPGQVESIESYLMLRSELKGEIENPNRYFDTTNVSRYKQLDMLLMTQGWRDFVWRRLADSALRISYAAEDGFKVSGKVRQKFANNPVKDINLTITAFKAKGQKLFTTRTDSAGKFAVENMQLYGQGTVKLNARNDKGQKAGWLIIDTATMQPLRVLTKSQVKIDTTFALVRALKKRQAELSKGNIKNGFNLKEVSIKARKTTLLQTGITAQPFGYPDQVFKITKKDELNQSLENWLVHNVQGIRVSPDQGVLLNDGGGGGASTSALIVNGREIEPSIGKWILDQTMNVSLALDDADKVLQQTVRQPYYDLTMDKVKSITFKHLVGQDPDYGKIINVYLLYINIVGGALESKDFGYETAFVDGYYEAKKFYKPQYDTAKDLAKPDLRTTIHWEPNIVTNANGEASVSFYNADPKTKVRVVVEGVKATGGPIVGSFMFTVK